MNLQEEDEPLWELLGRARKPVVSPFFARNIVREVRAQAPAPVASGWRWLLRLWQIPALGLCAALIAGTTFWNHPQAAPVEDPQLLAMAQGVSASPDYRVIGQLDELLDSEQNSVWLGGDSY